MGTIWTALALAMTLVLALRVRKLPLRLVSQVLLLALVFGAVEIAGRTVVIPEVQDARARAALARLNDLHFLRVIEDHEPEVYSLLQTRLYTMLKRGASRDEIVLQAQSIVAPVAFRYAWRATDDAIVTYGDVAYRNLLRISEAGPASCGLLLSCAARDDGTCPELGRAYSRDENLEEAEALAGLIETGHDRPPLPQPSDEQLVPVAVIFEQLQAEFGADLELLDREPADDGERQTACRLHGSVARVILQLPAHHRALVYRFFLDEERAADESTAPEPYGDSEGAQECVDPPIGVMI